MGTTLADESAERTREIEDEELLGGQEVVKGPRLLPSITDGDD